MENLNIIEQALNVANQRGCFTLQESAAIFDALNQLKQQINDTNKNGVDSLDIQQAKGQ